MGPIVYMTESYRQRDCKDAEKQSRPQIDVSICRGCEGYHARDTKGVNIEETGQVICTYMYTCKSREGVVSQVISFFLNTTVHILEVVGSLRYKHVQLVVSRPLANTGQCLPPYKFLDPRLMVIRESECPIYSYNLIIYIYPLQ